MLSLAILVSAGLVLSCERTDKQTESHTDADDRLTHATTISMSNNHFTLCIYECSFKNYEVNSFYVQYC